MIPKLRYQPSTLIVFKKLEMYALIGSGNLFLSLPACGTSSPKVARADLKSVTNTQQISRFAGIRVVRFRTSSYFRKSGDLLKFVMDWKSTRAK